jgi:putative acetyltransferase
LESFLAGASSGAAIILCSETKVSSVAAKRRKCMKNRQSGALTISRDLGTRATEIATITRDAFRRRYGSGDGEVAIVTRLRTDGDVIVELVALENGEVVGHAMFSRMTADPPQAQIAALGPVCVRIDRQGTGIGAAVIRAGMAACGEYAVAAVFVLGDPAYYGRFGFDAENAARVACAYSGPHLQALELRPGALEGVKSVAYAPAFAAV